MSLSKRSNTVAKPKKTVETVEEVVEKKTVAEVVEEVSGGEVVAKPAEIDQEASAAPVKSTDIMPSSGVMNMNSAMEELKAEGFDGLELDFNSFTGCVLNDGEFQFTNGVVLEKEGFICQLQTTRKKFKFMSNHGGEEAEVIYSYDKGAHLVETSPVAKKIQDWEEEGYELLKIQEYLEAWATVEEVFDESAESQELVGELAILSVPPTSRGRLSGFIMKQTMKGFKPGDYLVHVVRGQKVQNVDFPFYPWDFKIHTA